LLSQAEKPKKAAKRTSSSPWPDPIEWITENVWVPETPDKRLILAPYQEAVLRKALTPLENGTWPYSIVVWSDLKKSIKSTIAAAVALYLAHHLEWGQIVIVANDLKQADSRVGYYVRRAIELNPALRDHCKVRNYLIKFPGHTTIESVPIDPTGEAGGNADLVIFSELWGAHEKAQQRMWTEMTLPPAKFGRSMRWIETYAGYSGESTQLESLFETGTKQGVLLEELSQAFHPPLQVWENPTARMLLLWNQVPRLPWQTPEYYASEESVLHPNEFRRIHRNEWVSSLSAYIPMEWWDACRKPLPTWDPKKTPMILAADAAVSGDCFGLVGLSKYSEGTYLRYTRKWTPPAGGKIDYTAEGGPKGEILRLIREHNIVVIVYDPYQLHSLMMDIRKEAGVWVKEFPQGVDRLIADKSLYDHIQGKAVGHDGDPDMREHLQNANVKTEGDNKMRIVKRSETTKVDLAVCLSMADYTATTLNLG
jgi:phage terminase large subunit-like protein